MCLVTLQHWRQDVRNQNWVKVKLLKYNLKVKSTLKLHLSSLFDEYI